MFANGAIIGATQVIRGVRDEETGQWVRASGSFFTLVDKLRTEAKTVDELENHLKQELRGKKIRCAIDKPYRYLDRRTGLYSNRVVYEINIVD